MKYLQKFIWRSKKRKFFINLIMYNVYQIYYFLLVIQNKLSYDRQHKNCSQSTSLQRQRGEWSIKEYRLNVGAIGKIT